MIRLSATLVALTLGCTAILSSCAERDSTYADRNGPVRAGYAAPTYNCNDRGTCGGPTVIPGTAATDSPGAPGNIR